MTSLVPILPRELVTEILLRMRVKSLIRFRCVCREWCNLIDSAYFVNMHRARKDTRHDFLIVKGRSNSFLFSIDLKSLANTVELDLRSRDDVLCSMLFPTIDSRYRFMGSCNGLIYLSSYWTDVVLWNPSTNKHLFLPTLSLDNDLRLKGYNSLFYGALGFGFDSTSQTYKVVNIVQQYIFHTVADTEVKVFSIGSNSWRRAYGFPEGRIMQHTRDVLAKECLHWLVEESSSHKSIVAFNLQMEEFHKVPIPSNIDGLISLDNIIGIHVIEGCLSASFFCKDVGFELWMMGEYGKKDSWTKLISITDPYLFKYDKLWPIVYTKDVGVLLIEGGFGFPTRYIWHDFATKSFEKVQIYGLPEYFSAVMLLSESLVPLDGGGH